MTGPRRSIAIITAGTRGDVQPFVALAVELQRAGHKVRLAAHAPFREWIVAQGIEYAPLAGDPRDLLASEAGQQYMNPRSPLAFLRASRKFIRTMAQMLRQQTHDGMAAAAGVDALVYSFSAPLAVLVGEKTGLPTLCAALAPMTRTKAYANVMFGGRDFGPLPNLLSHRLFEGLVEGLLRSDIAQIRREHGLPRARWGSLFARHYAGRVPVLTAVSPLVVPTPRDWPAWHPVTGYWIVPSAAHYEPDAAVAAFLAAGPPPIYVGFGSMVDANPESLTALVLAAAATTGTRLLLSKGWSHLGTANLPTTVFALGDVPHEWLFPRLAGIVHHGGAGTTAAALRAGVPSLVVPFGVDQPFWGHRVAALGAGCRAIPRRKLTVDALASAFMRMTSDATMRRTAARLGEELRAERGVQAAVQFIESYLASWKS